MTLPFPYHFPRPELDSGGAIGLFEASLKHFQFGYDVISSFGPLQFLLIPSIGDPILWLSSMTFRLFTHSFFLFGIALFLIKSSVTWKQYFLVISITPILVMTLYTSAINDYLLFIPIIIGLSSFIVSELKHVAP
jgi:hypothetical protein